MIKSIASALTAALLASSALAQVPYTFGNQSGTVPASELDANFSYLSTVRAPVNLAPNSQWEIWSGFGPGRALKPDASGYEPTIAASGNTIKSDSVFTATISDGSGHTSNVMVVSALSSGTLVIGQTVTSATSNSGGAGIQQVGVGTTITGSAVNGAICGGVACTGNGGAGTYLLSNSSNLITAADAQMLYACMACGYTTFTVNNIGDLSVGDLVTASGAGIDSAFDQSCTVNGAPTTCYWPMRVTALPDSTHITVRLPRGQTPTANVAATITPIQIGAQWSATSGGGAGPDGWARYPVDTTAPILWRDLLHGPYAVNSPSNVAAYAALGVKLQAQGLNLVYINIPSAQLPAYAGKSVVFGAYVMQKVQGGSGTWQPYFQDSVNGRHTSCSAAPITVGVYQWMECSYTVPANATSFAAGISFLGTVNDAYYVVDPVLAIGSYIGGVKNYQKPKNEIIIPTVHVASNPFWINQTVTFSANQQTCGNYFGFCFTFDPYAETGGVVAPSVLKAHGQLEGWDTGAAQTGTGYVRVMAYWNQGGAPEISGSFMGQHAPGVKEFTFMDFPLLQNATADWQGTGFFSSGLANDTWNNVSFELDDFVLQ